MEVYVQVILPLKLEWTPYYRCPEGSVQAGDKVRVRFASRTYIGVVHSICDNLPQGLPESKILSIESIETSLDRISPETMRLWEQVAEYYMCTIGEVYKTACPAMKLDQELVKARIQERRKKKIQQLAEKIEKARKDTTRQKYQEELESLCAAHDDEIPQSAIDNLMLSAAQDKAYVQICEAFNRRKPVLLEGVTGSGKTEIYEKLALDAMKERNVLYLVPEIALSRQLEERMRKVFGNRLLIFHSHESAAARGEVANRVAHGNYIVLGTRSALFLPHHDLGLIIVDEEHDASYKQDSPVPRYNGRDLAVMLSSCQSSHIVLGSATPSLESLYNCKAGRFEKVELRERYHGAADSDVIIIDTLAERRKGGMMGSFSYRLINEISSALKGGSQIMLLRSRRSYSPAMQCTGCGDIPRCPKCNIPLSLHSGATERLMCNRCGWSVMHEEKCARCGGTLRGIGAGTQKIEDEAARLWPDKKVARLDSDVASDHKAEAEVVKSFARGEIDILVGTQMVSKGFDFEGVSLVAVLEADSLLGLQDFRADEKARQTLEQLRGRCGRRSGKGTFVIQTSNPGHPVYRSIAEGGNGTDLACTRLMEERRTFEYPPYCRIVEISVSDTNETRAAKMITSLANALHATLQASISRGGTTITGPCRNSLTISLKKDRALAQTKKEIRTAILKFEREYRYDGHFSINVDPA